MNNKFHRNRKRLSIWILLFTQILLIMSYFLLRVDDDVLKQEKISFVKSIHTEETAPYTYHTSETKLFLRTIDSRAEYIDFNSSLCYVNGTDLVSMKRTSDFNWECNCLPGWHGKDCGQPEVVWRAFLIYRKPIKITGPRTFQRRLIYIFKVDSFSETIADIRINELGDIVDLFVLYEPKHSNFLQKKLEKHFARTIHSKVLYLKEHAVDSILSLIKNLREDDIILTSNDYEIPNKFALNFLKYYNKWPEPIRFRLRWSVYGFFWVHPSKTIITGGACSVSLFKKLFDGKLESLKNDVRGIIFGDLNHYGGWYCEYCYDVPKILEFLAVTGSLNLTRIGRSKIDEEFLEEAIENGVYVNSKTELLRTHRYSENYFAPYYVKEHDWKFDSLLINFYSKMD